MNTLTDTTIPDRIPTATADRAVFSWQELRVGELMVQMHLEFPGRLDADRLARALDLAMDAEPVLGCRFAPEPKRPWLERLAPDQRRSLIVTQDAESFEAFTSAPPQPAQGPMVHACLFQSSQGDRLLLKADHTVADAGGTKDVAATVCRMYNRLGEDPHFRPEPNVQGSRSFSQIMPHLPWRAYPRAIWNFMRITKARVAPPDTHGLWPEAQEPGQVQYVVRHIPAGEVAALSDYARTRDATLNDMLCAALLRGLMNVNPWDGRSQLRLQMTVDMRRWYLPEGRAGAVCNLSAYDYIFLGTDPGAEFADTLDRVAHITRRRKKDWFGLLEPCLHPVMRSMSYTRVKAFFDWALKDGIKKHNIHTLFTNMGPIDENTVTFGGMKPSRAFLLVPPLYPPMVGCGLSGCLGELTLSAGVPPATAPLLAQLFEDMINQMPH